MIDDDDHCSMCDGDPEVGINGVLFCSEHAEEGWDIMGRAAAVNAGITDERRIAAQGHAWAFAYRQTLEKDDMEIGDTFHVDARGNEN